MAKRAVGFFKRRYFEKKDRYLPAPSSLENQRNTDTSSWVTISICTPLYNTPEKYLREFIDSVIGQTCGNWQLCLADASDEAHDYVGKIVKGYSDSRIRYKKIDNLGIAQNTNLAAELADGAYLALADHDDILAPHAIFMVAKAICKCKAEMLYSDEALFENSIHAPKVAHFKPDYAPEYMESCNYLCHLTVFKKELFKKVGGESPACDGSQDYDLFLKMIDCGVTPYHIPHVLYYWRVHENSTSGGNAAKPYVEKAGILALQEHLKRTGRQGTVQRGLYDGTYKIEWKKDIEPLVSILIPNKDHIDDLKKCLDSIYQKTIYKNFEILIIENNSEQEETFRFYKAVPDIYPGTRVEYYPGKFNFSAINNFGRRKANGEYLLMLNNDTEVLSDGWLSEMVSRLQDERCAICGAMLYYPDDTVQHAGIITGLGGYAGHSHKYHKRGKSGYMFRMATLQDFSAVTAACLLVRTSVFDEVGGMDEKFEVAFNDVDFCLRVRDSGYRIVWTPYAELYHYESKSRGIDEKDALKMERFNRERARLYEKHTRDGILHDPYYNPGLTLDREDFSESSDLRNLKLKEPV